MRLILMHYLVTIIGFGIIRYVAIPKEPNDVSITIKKIAELANVSAGTVDRVLHRRGKVKPEVEARVLEIATALNYKPNRIAKGLALKNKGFSVGVVSHVQPTYKNHAVNEGYEGIRQAEKECSDYGISLIYRYSKNFDVDSQVSQIKELVEEGIVALAITPINDPRISELLDKVITSGIPVFCFINNVITKNEHYFIGINNYRLGCVAAGLFDLLRKDRLQIALISPSLALLGNESRLKGFEYTIDTFYKNEIEISMVRVATDDDITSYMAVREMLNENPNINAIFFASGAVKGGMRAIDEFGVLGKALIVAVDPSDTIKKQMILGNIQAAINQNTRDAGYKTIKLIMDYIMFEYLPENPIIEIQSDIIIKEHLI